MKSAKKEKVYIKTYYIKYFIIISFKFYIGLWNKTFNFDFFSLNIFSHMKELIELVIEI